MISKVAVECLKPNVEERLDMKQVEQRLNQIIGQSAHYGQETNYEANLSPAPDDIPLLEDCKNEVHRSVRYAMPLWRPRTTFSSSVRSLGGFGARSTSSSLPTRTSMPMLLRRPCSPSRRPHSSSAFGTSGSIETPSRSDSSGHTSCFYCGCAGKTLATGELACLATKNLSPRHGCGA
jgi:hypothetical protein